MFNYANAQKKQKANLAIQHTEQAKPAQHSTPAFQRAHLDPGQLSTQDVLRLQQMAGNQAVSQLVDQAPKTETGLPEQVKTGVESLSGISLGDVRVHYNSSKPKELDARAYTQGAEIHISPGQEKHLSHEAWHVVQQKKGSVQPTFSLGGVPINDDTALETEARKMGTLAGQAQSFPALHASSGTRMAGTPGSTPAVVQRCADCDDPACEDGEVCSPDKTKSGRKYGPGQHGDKKYEQERLTAEYKSKVSGTSHESEHTVGYEPLSQTGDLPRKKSPRAVELENIAPAYQEVKKFHRAHIGTGMHSDADVSGFNSHEYRDAQRSLVEAGDVSSAVQLNQLGYAQNRDFQDSKDSKGSKIATDSYQRMVKNMKSMTYAKGSENKTVEVDPIQRAEMLLARKAAQTGEWPTAEEIAETKKSLGISDKKEGADGKS